VEAILEGQVKVQSLWKKMIGKPYSGKPNVRFDEGELEIEHSATTPALYSTDRRRFHAMLYFGFTGQLR